MKPIAVVTTVVSRDEAHRLARALVERDLRGVDRGELR